jgi:hypothetical protein
MIIAKLSIIYNSSRRIDLSLCEIPTTETKAHFLQFVGTAAICVEA